MEHMCIARKHKHISINLLHIEIDVHDAPVFKSIILKHNSWKNSILFSRQVNCSVSEWHIIAIYLLIKSLLGLQP